LCRRSSHERYERLLREALAKIVEVAKAAIHDEEFPDNDFLDDQAAGRAAQQGKLLVCTPKSLPKRLLVKAADTARQINPANAPVPGALAQVAAHLKLDPLSIAALTAKYWGPTPRRLTVSFMESTPGNLRARIVSHMNAWARTACITFVETRGVGQVRISRGEGGFWSYLGTDILHIPSNRQTMNLEEFTMSTPESEYKRVVRHETGHTLGFPHEHMRKELIARIDRDKAYEYFLQTQGWDSQTVDQQVLTPLDQRSIFGTPADQTSIMCYQLPGSITVDGRPILGGVDINQTDYGFAGRIYPRPGASPAPAAEEDWEEEEDVVDSAVK
jgi:hypothetical protein